ncbi:hypothetical protein F3Y22_tig00000991pilonHSYRG00069 [Hibiscus syriacus]|uniref:TF-B3 domain-containing protein n=1 Tax=Hibiscus syriacus TaxID=106335 RepID=A0A6A3D311_HIBSY|nr:B3 domain-containing protein At1g05920-like [Hibiscus syriacus]KAE8733762.1 hypothetical protein F3Y22_tig00000991pilonHSYRG00069 [Hibiscus syriacus]
MAVEVAGGREQGMDGAAAQDKLITENLESNKPSALSGVHDDESNKSHRILRLFGADIICRNYPETCSMKPEERVDDGRLRLESGEFSRAAKKPRQKDTSGRHQPVPDLPETFKDIINGMGGSGEKLIIQKKLYSTDLSKGHCRLSVPLNQVKVEFLTDEEKNLLEQSSKKSIEALIIEPCLRKSKMFLKRWEMRKPNGKPSSVIYVFTGRWNSLAKDNELKEGDLIQMWSFRQNSKLCFALVLVYPHLGE